MSRLQRIVRALRDRYGTVAPPPARTAFEHVLWEQVAYLATDAKRAAAFTALAALGGAIAAADVGGACASRRRSWSESSTARSTRPSLARRRTRGARSCAFAASASPVRRRFCSSRGASAACRSTRTAFV